MAYPESSTVAAGNTATAAQYNNLRYDGMNILTPGGRLTLTTGIAVTIEDVVSAATIYYTPYYHNRVPLWDGTRFVWMTCTEKSLALSGFTASKPHDVWLYNNSGTPALDKTAWTNNTTRATALTSQDGVWCKNGDLTRLYLGTIYVNSSNQTHDYPQERYVWNMYNRSPRRLAYSVNTDSWTMTNTAAWQTWANAGLSLIGICVGLTYDPVFMRSTILAMSSTTAYVYNGIGVDSQDTNSAQLVCPAYDTGRNPAIAEYVGYPGIGYHYLSALQLVSSGTGTMYGDNGTSYYQGLIAGWLDM